MLSCRSSRNREAVPCPSHAAGRCWSAILLRSAYDAGSNMDRRRVSGSATAPRRRRFDNTRGLPRASSRGSFRSRRRRRTSQSHARPGHMGLHRHVLGSGVAQCRWLVGIRRHRRDQRRHALRRLRARGTPCPVEGAAPDRQRIHGPVHGERHMVPLSARNRSGRSSHAGHHGHGRASGLRTVPASIHRCPQPGPRDDPRAQPPARALRGTRPAPSADPHLHEGLERGPPLLHLGRGQYLPGRTDPGRCR